MTVDGAPAWKAATQVTSTQTLRVAAPPRTYVSRGGEKLAPALAAFDVDPTGWHCLDAGASTGGFTDCLLQHGAAHVVACDVGYGQLHERLRTDPRVTVLERTNVRELTREELPGPPPQLVVADLSFISLRTVLPALREVAADDAQAVVLVKPQFEADRGQVGKGGVVRDPEVWRRCLERVADAAAQLGWHTADAVASELHGPAGNTEFLLHLVAAPDRASQPQAHDDAGSPSAGPADGGRPAIARALDQARHRSAAGTLAPQEVAG